MLNMKAMPAAQGAGLASYLWKEATSQDAPDTPALSTLDHWIAEGAEYEELIEIAYSERLARVRAAKPPLEPYQALHGLDGIDHELLRTKATEDVDAALARYDATEAERLAHFGVQYRATASEVAELLNVDLGAVPDLRDLQQLLSAKTADGQRIPGRFYRKDRNDQITMGSLELIFSADKSVSTVFGLASPEERKAIVAAQSRAVDVAMHQIAGKIGSIRSRRGGVDKRDPADVMWVQWQHRMSRRGDPQLHTHVSLINVVRSQVDGKVGTLDTFQLHGFYPTVRETYHRALAGELDKLGLPVKFDSKVPAAIITSVPDQVLRHFSGRTADAEQWLQERHGPALSAMTLHQRSNWLGHAAAQTRPPRTMYYVAGNGHAAWHARAAGQGYVPPPQFINPQTLQQAGIVHVAAQRHLERRRQQSHRINPQMDAHYNRGGGRFDDDYVLRRGQRL